MRVASVAWCLLLVAASRPAHADPIDDVVSAEMAKRKIPGLSLAIVDKGKIVKAKAYGVVRAGDKTPVTTKTLFQAGSISKPVAAVGMLHLVEKGQLRLDDDVNLALTSWKVPESELTKTEKVTLRRLVSHSAGLTVHGFPGYPLGGLVPTVIQILDGQPPANTPPIRVDVLPGSIFRYSGGGYTVMQQLLVDVTKKPFPALLKQIVLGPSGMTDSSYEQPLPAARRARAAVAHDNRRAPVPSHHHVYPEMAAAGLWTTATDLAKFGIGLQQSLAGRGAKVLSQKMARELVTRQKADVGLGVFLEREGAELRFSHGGRDEGFDALWVMTAESGQGFVIMINTNDNSGAMRRIADSIIRTYRWPGADSLPAHTAIAVEPAELQALAGRYELSNNRMITLRVAPEGDRLLTSSDGFPDDEIVPIAPGRFAARAGGLTFDVGRKGNQVLGLAWTLGKQSGKAIRLMPLLGKPEPAKDPDPAFTAKVIAAMKAIAASKADTPGLAIAPAARNQLSGYRDDKLATLTSLQFLFSVDVAGRGLERHEGKVARILVYRTPFAGEPATLLVHVTADGLLTDFDLIDE